MSDFVKKIGAAYPWVKAGHVTFVIFWMAGLFLVPRFYVYHHATTPGSAEDRAWTEREHFAHWFGPKGFRIVMHEHDLRVGGRLRFDDLNRKP